MNDFKQNLISLKEAQKRLYTHELYHQLSDHEALLHFMGHHVHAVWDFMSLLKALQIGLTCVEVPWKPVANVPKDLTRFINEIVLGEESDLGPDGNPCDHFTIYLQAMSEVGVSTFDIEQLIETGDYEPLPAAAGEFVEFNIKLAQSGELHKIAAAFFYGREKLIPEMFEAILKGLGPRKTDCPALVYYLERHIELDGGEHSILAEKSLELLCAHDKKLWDEAVKTGLKSLELREKLWDEALESYRNSRTC